MPEFEWDEAKRFTNLWKHKLDFQRAQHLFDGRPILIALIDHPDEVRLLATGILDDELVTAVWTVRGRSIRLISVRSARDAERRQYRQLHD
jgi:uncharacterized protein